MIEFELMECVFSAIVGGLLLLGILRDKAGYMLPWLVLFGLNVALLLIMSVLIVPLGLAMGMGKYRSSMCNHKCMALSL